MTPPGDPADHPPSGDRLHSTEASLFRHCPRCGGSLSRGPRRDRPRPECPRCGFIQWRNPVVGVAGVIFEEDLIGTVDAPSLEQLRRKSPALDPTGADAIREKPRAVRILLGRRTSSRFPGWCIPCGYVEFDEEIREAVIREMEEETGVIVRVGKIVAVHSNFHDPDRQSVGVWFRTMPVGGSLRPGDDVDALGLFPLDAPGVPLAFPTDERVIAGLRERGSEAPGS